MERQRRIRLATESGGPGAELGFESQSTETLIGDMPTIVARVKKLLEGDQEDILSKFWRQLQHGSLRDTGKDLGNKSTKLSCSSQGPGNRNVVN